MNYVRSAYYRLGEYSFPRQNRIVGNPAIGFCYRVYWLLGWLPIAMYLMLTGHHIKISNRVESTNNLKIRCSIETNYSADDFNSNYVKPEEWSLYNRLWDDVDFVFEFPDEVQVITNVVITPNQTQSLCPDNPYTDTYYTDPSYKTVLCSPNNNTCENERPTFNGVQTGKCVEADFPREVAPDIGIWHNVTTCQIKGWCPVQRVLPPLKDYNAVLAKTGDAVIWLRHNILFQDYNIRVNNFDSNILWDECHYNPEKAPKCPKFVIRDIIKYTKNAEVPYPIMAKFGATIVISVTWNCSINGFLCFFRKNYSSLNDCKPSYSFTRVDNILHSPMTGNRTYYYAHYFGNLRTHYLSYRIRFVVRVTGEVRECDFYQLGHEMIAMYGIFCAIVVLYRLYVTHKYKNKRFENTVPVNENDRLEEGTPLFSRTKESQL